jgi:RNA polymerase sigma-70 factor (ECF subfamily)
MADAHAATLDDVFAEHRQFLWSLCYRLTGTAADAEDLVQETFVRALERPPRDQSRPWRPWLVHVALNLGRDLLRRRRRRGYVGPWLPAPVETGSETSPPSVEPLLVGEVTTEGRYDLLESVSFAFLLALEALTPLQRAVLLLRDVFDYDVAGCAAALAVSAANVKTTHHRARRAMAAYDAERCVPTRARQEATREALVRFMTALTSGDVRAVEALLAESVRALTDGGGEFLAARVPIVGPARVARFYWNIAHRHATAIEIDVRMLNGLPAAVIHLGEGLRGTAARFVLRADIDASGRITALHSVLATAKLSALPHAAPQQDDTLTARASRT